MGNPVEHSKSPWIHARFAAAHRQPVEYGKRLMPLDGFAPALRAFRAEGGKGCNVTVPFKFEAAALAATRSAARAAGRRLQHAALRRGRHLRRQHRRRRAGARPAAQRGRGARRAGAAPDRRRRRGGRRAGAAVEAKPRRIVLANRTVGKAQALVASHAELARPAAWNLSASGLDAVVGRFDVVVNGTASSLSGADVPVPASRAAARRPRVRT
jgi:shikimate dehydrogenase